MSSFLSELKTSLAALCDYRTIPENEAIYSMISFLIKSCHTVEDLVVTQQEMSAMLTCIADPRFYQRVSSSSEDLLFTVSPETKNLFMHLIGCLTYFHDLGDGKLEIYKINGQECVKVNSVILAEIVERENLQERISRHA